MLATTNKILAQIKNMKNSSTSSFFLKTVNHLVTYSEVSIIQPLPSVSACKNHLEIVWTIQLSSDENRHDVHEDQGSPRCVQTRKKKTSGGLLFRRIQALK